MNDRTDNSKTSETSETPVTETSHEQAIVVESSSESKNTINIYKYLENFDSKKLYHVFVINRPERSLCNIIKLNEFQVTKLLDSPPETRPDMCPECETVKEMIDYED